MDGTVFVQPKHLNLLCFFIKESLDAANGTAHRVLELMIKIYERGFVGQDELFHGTLHLEACVQVAALKKETSGRWWMIRAVARKGKHLIVKLSSTPEHDNVCSKSKE